MKIAIFAEYYFPYISGVVTHIETLRQVLEAHGHEVLIVTLDPKCTEHYVKGGVLYCPAIPLKRIYGYGIANPLNLKRLRVVKAFDPDILHIHTEFTMGLFGQFAARKLKKPVVYTLHTMYDDYLFYVAKHKAGQKMMKPAAHLYIRKMANKATEVIGPSLKVVEYLRRCGVERHVNVIPNIVDTSAFLAKNVSRQQVDKVRAELGIRAGDTALCFVGRLGGEKSLDVLISWFCESFRGDGRFKLFIIGEGPEHQKLEGLVRQYHAAEQVRLLGGIEHSALPPYYHACDAFATASLSEMNSISMLEAMASGLYVLQRLDLYNKDQIAPGVSGDFFSTREGFAALCREQAALSGVQKAARRAGVEAESRKYGKGEFAHRVLDVYQRAAAEYSGK